MIPLVRPYLPNRKKLEKYVEEIYHNAWLTNDGPLVKKLTGRIEEYLGVENVLLVANGTLALQVCYKVFGISGQVVTTPFTFVATVSSLVWEGLSPVFSDIDPSDLCLDPSVLESAITPDTSCVLPVHVFGNSCDVKAIDSIARKHNLKVIYDGAHAFGSKYKDVSLLSYGDAATLSFHATKIFHTAEGGAIVFKSRAMYEKAKRMINFGINAPNSFGEVGINAKMSEFQAAVGLCVLDEIDIIMEKRSRIVRYYEDRLADCAKLSFVSPSGNGGVSYFPVIFDDEATLLKVYSAMFEADIEVKRYFYPSLDVLPYVQPQEKQYISRSVSERILCLPLYPDLSFKDVDRIISVVRRFSE